MKIRFITLTLALLIASSTFAQSNLTREQILNMSTEELSDLPLEDLMQAVETLGVSSVDELFAMIMNKNVSSASKKEEDSFTSPLSSTVITKAEMRTYGISTIEEALRLIPGMIVTEKTNGVYDVQMRGLNNIPDNQMFLYTENSNTLVMIDGRPSHNYAMGSVNAEMWPISIEDVERIEVVRGACSALYGQNAVTGIINIITEKPDAALNAVSGSFQMGNQNSYIGDIAIRKSISDKLSIGVTASVQYRRRNTDKLYVCPDKGIYIANDADITKNGTIHTPAEFQGLIATGALKDVSEGGYYSIADIKRLRQVYSVDGQNYSLFNCTEDAVSLDESFKDPGLAKETKTFNGYVSYNPSKDVNLDFSFGYQQSFVNTTLCGDDYYSFSGRQSKNVFANLNSQIFGLSLNAGFTAGPQDYCYGTPGFKVNTYTFNGSAEYEIKAGDLSIVPGVTYQHIKYEDYETPYVNGMEISGFFGYRSQNGGEVCNAEITDLAPSLRLDYKVGDFRVTAAVRGDKTNIPDKWNPSWQLAANYSINSNNFVRFVYGRANRSATFSNTQTNFDWQRTNLVIPNSIKFEGNKNADLMNIDAFELGYRWKPSKSLLIDVEAYYSQSRDYGALTSKSGNLTLASSALGSTISTIETYLTSSSLNLEELTLGYDKLKASGMTDAQIVNTIAEGFFSEESKQLLRTTFMPSIGTEGVIQYKNLPFEVQQMGLSLNIDWIISSKLIAKINANVQKTTIDKYYPYSQTEAMKVQLANCESDAEGAIVDILGNILINAGRAVKDGADKETAIANAKNTYVVKAMQYYNAEVINKINNMTDAERDVLAQDFYNQGEFGAYYAAKYGIYYVPEENIYKIGSAAYTEPEKVNGHENKATPNIYGAFGLIYKPMTSLTVSAFGNFLGKSEYTTKYGTEKLNNRFTVNLKVGYAPVDGFEIFFNAHNLFDSKAREFTCCDEMGLLYSFGVNFGF